MHTLINATIKKNLTITDGARECGDKMVSWRVNIAREVGRNKNSKQIPGWRRDMGGKTTPRV